jgi:hypothetical protein
MDEMKVDLCKLQNGELHRLYSSSGFITVIKTITEVRLLLIAGRPYQFFFNTFICLKSFAGEHTNRNTT